MNEDYEIRFTDRRFTPEIDLNVFLYSFTDGSARFFGFQSDSHREDEINYGDEEIGLTVTAGYRLWNNIQLVLGERVRKVDIVQGAVENIPFIRDRFTPQEVPGINGFFSHTQSIGLFIQQS